MARQQAVEASVEEIGFSSPVVGTILTVAAGLAFQFLCMVLPLVGKAGMAPEREYAVRGLLNVPGPHGFDSYVGANKITFVAVWCVAAGLALAAMLSKLQRRGKDGSPFPAFSTILLICCAVLMIAHVTGYLRI